MEKLLTRIAWFVGLVLVQVLFLNHICWFGVATPFLYIYLLLIIDRDIDRNVLMLLAFAMGLSVDVFCNTFGVNAAACVLLAFLRPWLIRICAPREEFENFEPGYPDIRHLVLLPLCPSGNADSSYGPVFLGVFFCKTHRFCLFAYCI